MRKKLMYVFSVLILVLITGCPGIVPSPGDTPVEDFVTYSEDLVEKVSRIHIPMENNFHIAVESDCPI